MKDQSGSFTVQVRDDGGLRQDVCGGGWRKYSYVRHDSNQGFKETPNGLYVECRRKEDSSIAQRSLASTAG